MSLQRDWHRRRPDDCILLFTDPQEVPEPPFGTSMNNLTSLTDLEGWKEGGLPVLGVFLCKETGRLEQMAPSAWSLSVCCSSSAVQIRLPSLFHDFLRSFRSLPQIGYHGDAKFVRQFCQTEFCRSECCVK